MADITKAVRQLLVLWRWYRRRSFEQEIEYLNPVELSEELIRLLSVIQLGEAQLRVLRWLLVLLGLTGAYLNLAVFHTFTSLLWCTAAPLGVALLILAFTLTLTGQVEHLHVRFNQFEAYWFKTMTHTTRPFNPATLEAEKIRIQSLGLSSAESDLLCGCHNIMHAVSGHFYKTLAVCALVMQLTGSVTAFAVQRAAGGHPTDFASVMSFAPSILLVGFTAYNLNRRRGPSLHRPGFSGFVNLYLSNLIIATTVYTVLTGLLYGPEAYRLTQVMLATSDSLEWPWTDRRLYAASVLRDVMSPWIFYLLWGVVPVVVLYLSFKPAILGALSSLLHLSLNGPRLHLQSYHHFLASLLRLFHPGALADEGKKIVKDTKKLVLGAPVRSVLVWIGLLVVSGLTLLRSGDGADVWVGVLHQGTPLDRQWHALVSQDRACSASSSSVQTRATCDEAGAHRWGLELDRLEAQAATHGGSAPGRVELLRAVHQIEDVRQRVFAHLDAMQRRVGQDAVLRLRLGEERLSSARILARSLREHFESLGMPADALLASSGVQSPASGTH